MDSDSKEIEKYKREKKKAEQKGNLKEASQYCNYIGELLSKKGCYDDAVDEHKQELFLCEALKDDLGSAVAHRKIGECYASLGQYDKALRHQKLHLRLAEAEKSDIEMQRALATIGRTYLLQAESLSGSSEGRKASTKAESAFEQSLDLCKRLHGSISQKELAEMKARLLLNLGLLYDVKGNVKKCGDLLKQAIAIAEQHNLQEDLFRGQLSLAGIYQSRAMLSQALRLYDGALKCAQKLRDKAEESNVLIQKALIFVQLGDFSAAMRVGKKAYKMSASAAVNKDDVAYKFKTVVLMNSVSEELHHLEDTDYTARLPLYEKLGDLASRIGHFQQAIKCYQNMLKCALAVGKTGTALVPIYVSLAQTYLDDKQYEEAIDYFYKELECHGENYEQRCRTLVNIANAKELVGGNGYESIKAVLNEALECARKADHKKLQVHVLKSLAESEANFHRDDDREETLHEVHQIMEEYGIASDEELSEPEDSQNLVEEADVDLDDVAVTDTDSEGDNEEYDRGQTATGRPARRVTKSQLKRNEKGETALHRACIEGNLKKVKILLSQGHPVNPRDYCGWIPLHEAANHDHLDIIKALLDNGAWINDRGGEHCSGITPLHDACNCGNAKVIHLLVEHGANIHAKDNEANTPSDSLDEYVQRSRDILSRDDMMEIQATQKLLKSTMKGNNPHLRTSTQSKSGRVSSDIDDLPTMQPHVRRPRSSHTQRSEDVDVMDDLCSSNRRLSSGSEEDSPVSPFRRQDRHHSLLLSESYGQTSPVELPDIDPQPSGSSHQKKPGKRSRAAVDEEDEDFDETAEVDNIAAYRGPPNHSDFPTLHDPTAARSAYQEAIASMRMSATSRTQSQLHKPLREREEQLSGHGPALINEKNFIGDDWLIDDVGTAGKPSKRKKIDMGPVYRSSTRKSSESERRPNRERKRSHEDEHSDGPLPVGLNAPHETDRVEETVSLLEDDTGTEMVSDDMDFLFLGDLDNVSMVGPSQSSPPLVTVSPASHPSSNPSQRSSRLRLAAKKPRQSKLTNFGMTVMSSLPSHETRLSGSSTGAGETYRDVGFSQQPPVTPSSQTSTRPVMRLKVRIRNRCILVPVPSAHHTIGWLQNEVCERYYKLYSLRPLLALSTKDGAMLSPEDHVADLLSNDEEIEGQVEGWDLPPLQQRYTDACKAQNSVVYRNVQNLLAGAAGSQCLTLADLALRPVQFSPICKALQCQHSLKEVCLQGNKLGDDGVAALSRVLPTLPSLRTLNLAANHISAVGLRSIAMALEATPSIGSERPLQVLEGLKLSFNPLGDSCTQTLATMVRHLPTLTSLKLQSCDFTLRLFQQHRLALAESFQGSCLHHLDLSYNKLTSTGVELLLMSVSPTSLLSLTLTAVLPSYTTNHMIRHLVSYLTRPDCCLQRLVLDNCYLLPEHWPDVTRFISQSKSLQHLSMSANQKLCNNDITELLEAAGQSETSRLSSLVFTGCSIRGPLSSQFLDSLNDKTRHGFPLQHLEFTCHGQSLEKLDQQSLQEIWESRWADDAFCDITSTRVRLSTTEHQRQQQF